MDKRLETFECKLCGKRFGSQEEMKRHSLETHSKHKQDLGIYVPDLKVRGPSFLIEYARIGDAMTFYLGSVQRKLKPSKAVKSGE